MANVALFCGAFKLPRQRRFHVPLCNARLMSVPRLRIMRQRRDGCAVCRYSVLAYCLSRLGAPVAAIAAEPWVVTECL
jgi:hypothetical protein